MADKIKFVVALALVVAGLWAYYALSASAMVIRIVSVIAGLVAGGAVAWFTQPGQRFFAYSRESVDEAKKVAWPTRKESFQTTGAVFAFVVVMAVFLWLTDKSLEWAMYDLILGWKK